MSDMTHTGSGRGISNEGSQIFGLKNNTTSSDSNRENTDEWLKRLNSDGQIEKIRRDPLLLNQNELYPAISVVTDRRPDHDQDLLTSDNSQPFSDYGTSFHTCKERAESHHRSKSVMEPLVISKNKQNFAKQQLLTNTEIVSEAPGGNDM